MSRIAIHVENLSEKVGQQAFFKENFTHLKLVK